MVIVLYRKFYLSFNGYYQTLSGYIRSNWTLKWNTPHPNTTNLDRMTIIVFHGLVCQGHECVVDSKKLLYYKNKKKTGVCCRHTWCTDLDDWQWILLTYDWPSWINKVVWNKHRQVLALLSNNLFSAKVISQILIEKWCPLSLIVYALFENVKC